MDSRFELNGTSFVWDSKKAAANSRRHEGITFEQAATVFFDPFMRVVDASRRDEARDAVIGYCTRNHMLFVVFIERDDEAIRIVSARKAGPEERKEYDS